MQPTHTAKILTVRHGEKDEEGKLTRNGFYQGALRAIEVKHLNGEIKLYHSGVGRVFETIFTIGALLHKEKADFDEGITDYISSMLKYDKRIDDHVVPELQYLYNPSVKGEYFSTWNQKISEEKANTRIQEFLNLHEKSPDEGVAPGPKEMAQRLSTLLINQITEATSTPHNVTYNFINGTHEPILMSFLAYLKNDFEKPKPDFVKSIGGTIGYAEGFDIDVYQSEDNEIELKFIFRGMEAELNLEDIKNFVST